MKWYQTVDGFSSFALNRLMHISETELPLILLLEDSTDSAKLYELILSDNYEVVHCASVREAAELLTLGNYDFDAVVSDYHLLDGTCFDVYHTYRLMKGDGMPPWLLITADPNGVEFAAEQEGLMVLEKPINRWDLIDRIDRLTKNVEVEWARRSVIRQNQRTAKMDYLKQRENPWA